ncbi:GNAT family N-acetyltransferase [Paenibacillus athensensis]|uniref:N-acetyltransferase domain-containing protein n=1 Tax=Paenibacillus athensensis TaxID=1967502 RepID=A0A4Y8Q881_9BACL|nr:GNAT family N-acetyltransferase [Paenibacillus athensensis]MCD1257355.1 GNAT family N-acetyltransferase [Paenibacillus athensensis]
MVLQINKKLLGKIDHLALRLWPAEETEPLGSWLLRASRGISQRANSVFTGPDYPSEPDWLARIERFYAARGLPAIFQLGGDAPEQLDRILEQMGYVKEIPCLILIADSSPAVRLADAAWRSRPRPSVEVCFSPEANPAWIDALLRLDGFPRESESFYRGIAERMSAPKTFVTLLEDDEPVGLGTAVADEGWAGFVNLVIREDRRGCGLGHLLVRSLAEWSAAHGASHLYLQVVANNDSAIGLYGKSGFKPLCGYHYRIKYDLTAEASS